MMANLALQSDIGKPQIRESGSWRRLGANLLVSAQVRPYTVEPRYW